MDAPFTREEVEEKLSSGGELWYLYLSGDVMVHVQGQPVEGKYCPLEIFLELQKQKKISKTGQKDSGYPWYTDKVRVEIYTLTRVS